jgi:glycosyltransferase involved in cell wall biosynthesis
MVSTGSSPLVSIVVPTKNSSKFLDACLRSIQAQTYPNIELIVVDNFSADNTVEIAEKYTKHIYQKGPERSAQVNFGVEQASGEYVYKVDSDFVLEPTVVQECVDKIREGYDAVIVHNTPDASVSWIAKIRKFEVDMYKDDFTYLAARFLSKEIYQKIGGFDVTITAGEDYDFQNRLNRAGYKTGLIKAEAVHLGEPTSFWKHMKKYYNYGRNYVSFQKSNEKEANQQLGFFRDVYFKNWRRFIRQPVLGLGFIGYNVMKYFAGGLGFLSKKPGLTVRLISEHVRYGVSKLIPSAKE